MMDTHVMKRLLAWKGEKVVSVKIENIHINGKVPKGVWDQVCSMESCADASRLPMVVVLGRLLFNKVYVIRDDQQYTCVAGLDSFAMAKNCLAAKRRYWYRISLIGN